MSSFQIQGPAGVGVGTQIAYAEITSPVTVSATVEATPDAVVSSGALTYSAVLTRIEFYAPLVEAGGTANSYVIINLWDDVTNLGRIAVYGHSALTFLPQSPCFVARYLTPTAGSHTYKITAFRSTSNGAVGAGVGGAGANLPAFIRVTTA